MRQVTVGWWKFLSSPHWSGHLIWRERGKEVSKLETDGLMGNPEAGELAVSTVWGLGREVK